MACMNACTVVGPTNVQPRFFRSLLIAVDSGLVGLAAIAVQSSFDRAPGRLGSNCQTYEASEPNSPFNSMARRALLMVDSILPRCLTMPASLSRRFTSRLE